MKYYAAIAVLTLLTACQSQPPAEVPAQEPAPTVEASPEAPTLSQELYDQIENGMTLKQAQEILGEGTEMSRTQIDGLPETIVWMWAEDNGIKNITVTIQGEEIISKAKAGF